MRLIEHTPKRWAEHLKLGRPIAESIMPMRGRFRNWKKMSDAWMVICAQWFVENSEIKNRSGLENADSGLYMALVRRNLLDRIKFDSDERAWSRYSDDELVWHAQRFIEEGRIESRSEAQRADPGLYESLRGRRLIERLRFKADERFWSKYSDDELVAFAQRFVDENGISSRTGLRRTDGGFYGALYRRKLVDKVKFKVARAAWCKYSDDELVVYAQGVIDVNRIESRSGLQKSKNALYQILLTRKLLDRVFSSLEENREIEGLWEISDAMGEFKEE